MLWVTCSPLALRRDLTREFERSNSRAKLANPGITEDLGGSILFGATRGRIKMRNGRLDAAKAFLKKAGYDDIPDSVILDLMEAVKGKSAELYEKGDFVEVYEGMGEMGHGTVVSKSGQNYRVKIWSHDPAQYPEYERTVTQGDMRGLSTPDKAMDYYLIRSGQKK